MGVATVFATAGFAAVSGASVATSAVFARIAIPEMLKIGYDKRFAAGVVAAGGTLASLIPPSAILVIYAIIVEQDVGALLLAGFLPGAVSALIYGGLVVLLAMFNKNLGPPVKGYSWGERFKSLPPAFPIFFVVIIIICFIYNPFGGDAWGTPTEGGAIGAFVIFVMALILRHALATVQRRLDGNSQAGGDDFHHHLGRFDLCAFLGLRGPTWRILRLGDIARSTSDDHADLHPSSLRRFWVCSWTQLACCC